MQVGSNIPTWKLVVVLVPAAALVEAKAQGGLTMGNERQVGVRNDIQVVIDRHEHEVAETTVGGTFKKEVSAQAKTNAVLDPPQAKRGADGMTVRQRLGLDTYLPKGASEALKNAERQRPGSLIGWALDRYPDLVAPLTRVQFTSPAAAERAVDQAVRKDFENYRNREKLYFDFRPEGQPGL
jgi:hypothetical protein